MKNIYSQTSGYFKRALVFVLSSVVVSTYAQTYPFTLPSIVTATYDVQTGQKEVFRNKLLGYNIEGFKTEAEKNLIRKFDPISIRFPHGVWANFYQWQTDKYQKDNYPGNTEHQAVLDIYVSSLRGSIDEIKVLNDEKKARTGKPFNMMWTYSMNFDDATSCVNRATQDIQKGFQVENIELGNELYYSSQRANQTSTPTKIANRSEAVAYALKAKFPQLKVSIPMDWSLGAASYNTTVAKDGKYFDAVSVHAYMGADAVDIGPGDTQLKNILTTRLLLSSRVKFIRDNYAPGKPVWLSEWGVSPGDNTVVTAASCLGMADVFLYMSENQGIFETANWFAFNDPLNAMIVVGQDYTGPVYPLMKRGYLSTYEIIYDVLKDANLFKGTMSTSTLTTSKGSVDGVTSRVVEKDGKVSAVVINLTNKPVEYILKIDGANYTGAFKHEALAFANLGNVAPIPVDQNPLAVIKDGSGKITLPPLSISKISNLNLQFNITGPAGYTYATNEYGTVDIPTNPYDIAYGHNGSYVYLKNQTGSVPCTNAKFGSDPLPNTAKYCFIKESKAPYLGSPAAIPGTIEAENYDFGGQGVSYSDSDPVNSGATDANFRIKDGVDIGKAGAGYLLGWTQDNEWLEYTVNIAQATDYDMNISYASLNGGGKIGMNVDGVSKFTGLIVPSTGSWSAFGMLKQKVSLPVGQHVVRVLIEKSGFNLDKIEFVKSPITGTEGLNEAVALQVYPNPSSGGVFLLSKTSNWEVYSINGLFIKSGSGDTIDLSNETTSVYLLKIDGEVFRIVK
jgi:Carbohydrate binding module (family 6)